MVKRPKQTSAYEVTYHPRAKVERILKKWRAEGEWMPGDGDAEAAMEAATSILAPNLGLARHHARRVLAEDCYGEVLICPVEWAPYEPGGDYGIWDAGDPVEYFTA